MTDVIFFGVASGTTSGHHFYERVGSSRRMTARPPLPAQVSRSEYVDARWCFSTPSHGFQKFEGKPQPQPQPQGHGFIHRVAEWTLIAWWDRSGDTRLCSNAAFFVRGVHQWAEALRRAREAFPGELARMEAAYQVHLAGEDLPLAVDDPTAAIESAAAAEAARLRALHPDVLVALRRIMGWP